jgi:tetratricopeptide (TPR) repeat protein
MSEFDVHLSVARASSICVCEMSTFCSACDCVETLGKMLFGASEHAWALTVFCCGRNVLARDICLCAWLMWGDSCNELVRESEWSGACERMLEQMDSQEAVRGFAMLARLLYERDGQFERAQFLYERRCDLTDSATLAQFVVLRALRGDVKGAMETVEQLEKGSQLYYFTLGLIHEHGCNFSGALAALAQCSQSASVLVCKGRVLLKKGLLGESLAAFEEGLSLRSELDEQEAVRVECQVAVLRAEMSGKTAEAEELFRRRLVLNVRDDEAWLDLSVVQCEKREWSAALESAQQCAELRVVRDALCCRT